jgi:hypothetical protein
MQPVGRLGADGGRDIRAFERVSTAGDEGQEREWRFQVKRQREVGPEDLRKIVREAVPDPDHAPHAVIAVVAAPVSAAGLAAFEDEAKKLGVEHIDIWDRSVLNDRLTFPENADLRALYFGREHAIDATIQVTLGLGLSAGRDLELTGREQQQERISVHDGDLLISGVPGAGKTRLAFESGDVRFLNHEAQTDDIADSIRRHRPDRVAIDDAGLDVERLKTLLELRKAGHQFAIVATVWPEDLDRVRRWLPDALVVEIGLLERKPMDEILQGLGISNYYLRAEILRQAEGRPGWAVALADLAIHGRGGEVLTGRGLIDQIEPFLSRLGSSVPARGLLSLMAALGAVDPDEWDAIDGYLRLNRLERHELVVELASAGLLERVGDRLRVAPESLRIALVAHWFFEQATPWRITDLLEPWHEHRVEILAAVLGAASMGSASARATFDELVPDLAVLRPNQVELYAALDEHAATRALATALPQPAREKVVISAARRFLLVAAVRELLDAAVGDDRPQHSHPDHPIRLLGEIGTRIDPHGQTGFPARAILLGVASDWLDEDPTPERALAWSKLVVHLLGPSVEGNYQELGEPMSIRMQAGFESPPHLESITRDLWPAVEARVPRLNGAALVNLVELADEWVRLGKGYQGAFGATPDAEAVRIAESFGSRILETIARAAADQPVVLTLLKERSRMFGLGISPRIEPEFRILTWQPWRLPRRGQSGLISSTARKLADCWATEDPDELMGRIASHEMEARKGNRDLAPMIHVAMGALAARTDVEPLIEAGMRHGLTYQLRALLQESLQRSAEPPAWLSESLGGKPLRREALVASLAPNVPEAAAKLGLDSLTGDDLLMVEGALFERSQGEPDWVARALLNHSNPEIRGAASLCFSLGTQRLGAALPSEWRQEWGEAFVHAPVESTRAGDNYRLGIVICDLVGTEPDLIERWLVNRLNDDPWTAIHRLPENAENCLRSLPIGHRVRIMRATPEGDRSMALATFMNEDVALISTLLDDGVMQPSEVLQALHWVERDDEYRVANLLAIGPTLISRGITAERVAGAVGSGGWSGEESSRDGRLRAAFEASDAGGDPQAAAIRAAGMRMFAEERDRALSDEHRNRIRGEI